MEPRYDRLSTFSFRSIPSALAVLGVIALTGGMGGCSSCGGGTDASYLVVTVEAEVGVPPIQGLDVVVVTLSTGSQSQSFVPTTGSDFIFPVTLAAIDVTGLSGTATVSVEGSDTGGTVLATGSANASLVLGTNNVTVLLTISGGEFCGDSVANGVEDCDGVDLDGNDCTTIGMGFTGGTLACTGTCDFDTGGCTGGGVCGDGTMDPGEECDDGNTTDGDGCSSLCAIEPPGCGDGTCDLAGTETCANCVVDCATDPACQAMCGDGTVDAGEDCDGVNLDGNDCTTIGMGFTGGTLACSGTCAFDTSSCTAGGMCGNGIVDAGEDCDGTNLDGNDCTTIGMGFTGGTLACTGGCVFDVGACVADLCLGVDCTALDDMCNTGVCDPATGLCSAQPVTDGTACDDGALCTVGDACLAGACQPGTVLDCSALTDMCNTGFCDTATGMCDAMPFTDGTACDDGSACTTTDTCQTGVCTPGPALDCSGLSDMCNTGMCDTTTGCFAQPVSDGTGCSDANACTTPDSCQTGVCAPGPALDCSGLGDQCNTGICDATSGCFASPLADGTPCDDGDVCTSDACMTGTCTGTAIGNDCDIYSALVGGFIDITVSPTAMQLATLVDMDDSNENVTLPFTFPFFGVGATTIGVTTNGFINVGTAGSATYTNTSIPSGGAPNSAIYPFWDDLRDYSGQPGTVWVDFRGTSPNQIAIIQWSDFQFYTASGSRLSFEVVLHENGTIQFLYGVTTRAGTTADRHLGASATAGIENAGGTVAYQFSFNMTLLEPGLIVNYVPDGAGGYTETSEYNLVGDWIDIRGSGTLAATASGCDDCTQTIPMPFDFSFFGTVYGPSNLAAPNVHISSNGNIQFGTTASSDYLNTSLPSTGDPDLLISCLHDDLDPTPNGNIYYQVIGTAPNRIFVVEYVDVEHYPGASSGIFSTFEFQLYETTNVIQCLYGSSRGASADVIGSGATAGIQDATQTVGYTASYNAANLGQGAVVAFVPNANGDTTGYGFFGPDDVFPDITRTAGVMMSTAAGGDDTSQTVPLGFTFTYYGNTYTDVSIGSNGYLTFGGGSGDYTNDPIPSAGTPNNILAAFWDDLDPADNATNEIYYVTTGPVGAEVFTAHWQSIEHYPGSATTPDMDTTFAVQIFEATGQIIFYYGASIWLTGTDYTHATSATVGIENDTGLSGIEIGYNHDGTALCGSRMIFTP